MAPPPDVIIHGFQYLHGSPTDTEGQLFIYSVFYI